MSRGRVKVVHALEIYDGRDRLGEVQELATGQLRAVDPHDREIGVFDSMDSARSAVLARRNGRAA